MTSDKSDLSGLYLLINDSGHWVMDDVLGVQVGSMGPQQNGSWYVDVNDEAHEAPDEEAAKRLFVTLYDPSLIPMGPGSGGLDDGLESPYEWIEGRNGTFIVIGPDEDEHVCATEVEAINLVKRLHEGPFSYFGLEGEEGDNGTRIVSLAPIVKELGR